MSEIIKVYIFCHTREVESLCYNTIEQLVLISGWKTTRVYNEDEAQICYQTSELEFSNLNAYKIPSIGADAWINIEKSIPFNLGGNIIPDKSIIRANSSYKLFDIVYTAHYFLSGIYERCDGNVNELGIPNESAKKWGLQNSPVVNLCASILKKYILNISGIAPAKPQWPENKKWAIALSHDCDQPFRYRYQSFFNESIRALKKFNLKSGLLEAMKFSYSSVMSLTGRDHFWESWNSWRDWEAVKSVKTTYFVATRNRFDPKSDPRDVPYKVSNSKIKALVKDIHNRGWDVGLHSSINAHTNQLLLLEEINSFYINFGFLPVGIRSHFWSLGNQTFDTIKMFSGVDFIEYDSSLGIDNYPGFRRGVGYPFFPYNEKERLSIIEIPPVIMDWGLFSSGSSSEQRINVLRRYIEIIKSVNGVLVLDWHDYTLSKYIMENLGADLLSCLDHYTDSKDCYFASCAEIAQWCKYERWKTN